MKNRICVIATLLVITLVAGCTQSRISKQEVESIAYNFCKEYNFNSIKIINSYKESPYWKVTVNAEGSTVLLEINDDTGKVEYIVENGRRYSVDDLKMQALSQVLR